MAATIDNLESHFRYRVIRGFTDAKGVRVPFEATGVIRRIDLSDDMTELHIDWEPEGTPPGGATERLTFLMAAADGPRNGHMRSYFEKGELVMPPRPRKPHLSEAASRPAHVEASLPDFGGQQPQDEIPLGARAVACNCDPAFHRAIWPAGEPCVHACLRCGAVTVTRQVGDDGRHTGETWTAYRIVPTPQIVVDWLGRFPRIAIDYAGAPPRWPMSASLVRYPILAYPAETRVADVAALEALESRLAQDQAGLSRAWRIGPLLAGLPPQPPGLPPPLHRFHTASSAAGLRAGTDLATLKAHAHLLSPTTELAADLLLRRPNALDVMMKWLGSGDEAEFSAGVAMLRDSRRLFSGPDDPRLAPPLLALLNSLPLGPLEDAPGRVESCMRFEALLVAIADLGADSPQMAAGLKSLKRKIAAKDRYVAEAIDVVLGEFGDDDAGARGHA